MVALEEEGTPAAVLVSDAFERLAKTVAASLGVNGYLPLAILPHPIAGLPDDEVAEVTVPAVPALAAALTADRTASPSRAVEDAPGWRGGTWEDLERDGFGDGLPLVPPTPGAVDAMLGALAERRHETIGLIPPRLGAATYEVVAANAVMAGCLPEYLPVVVAALRAMLEPEFNLLPLQTTTHPAAPMIMVNGPIRDRIGMNYGAGCLGSGNRANATIGRAVRLVLQNVGGARPGAGDRSTQAHPGKYSYCFAENEESSPWEPLSRELGYPEGVSTVTVVAGEAPHNVNDHSSTTATGILTTLADTMATMGKTDTYVGFGRHSPMVVFSPEHAETVAREGLSKDDVRRFLFEHAREPLGKLKLGGMWTMRDWPAWLEPEDDEALVPIVAHESEFVIVVAGGDGKHSMYIPTMGVSRVITVAIE
jgi:hypothetical protein